MILKLLLVLLVFFALATVYAILRTLASVGVAVFGKDENEYLLVGSPEALWEDRLDDARAKIFLIVLIALFAGTLFVGIFVIGGYSGLAVGLLLAFVLSPLLASFGADIFCSIIDSAHWKAVIKAGGSAPFRQKGSGQSAKSRLSNIYKD